MKTRKNIEKFIKNAAVNSNPQMNRAVLNDLLKQLDKKENDSRKEHRSIIMKSTITKLAAAAVIIIAAFIVINQFGGSVMSVAWADVAEHFESVPFFNLTIYAGHDTSAEAIKIEIWKSENARVRAHQGNNIIFADFSDGKNEIIAFDRTTKQPVNAGGLAMIKAILNDLCPQGRFSLDTLINSFPSDANGVTPVETADTAASRETVVFEARHKATPEWIQIWALRGSKLPIRVRFRDPRSNECSDIFFNYSEKMNDTFFTPDAFTKE